MLNHLPRLLRYVVGAALTTALLTACAPPPAEEALLLVERYNTVVAEAYRTANLTPASGLLGEAEARRIQSLIEVRGDRGLILDSELLSLEILEARRGPQEFEVSTRERWRYCDRSSASAQPLTDPIVDAYEMIYHFRRQGGTWVAEEIHFASAPRVARRQFLWSGEPSAPSAPAGGLAAAFSSTPPVRKRTVPDAAPSAVSSPASQP